MSMFCYQCQETAKGKGCDRRGVCGKPPEVAGLQDLLIYLLKGISAVGLEGEKHGLNQEEADRFIMESLFATVTNVNFDDRYFVNRIGEALELRDKMVAELESKGGSMESSSPALTWTGSTEEEYLQQAEKIGILSTGNEDVRSLRELITYGVKGMAAYAEHAFILGYSRKEIFHFMKKALAATLDDDLSVEELISLVMDTGKHAVEVMSLLDEANVSTYGAPEITEVDLGVRNSPGILVSGHDLKDLEELLEQTRDSGIDVYTHGEMLPAHYYPFFQKYPHFAGNYGNAWWRQKEEFASFNGPVVMTTNCLVPPGEAYLDRLYTTGPVGYPGVKHLPPREAGGTKDFSPVLEQAQKCSPPEELEKGKIVGGFAHNAILGLADKVVDAVKSGAVRRFVVMAGCDGRQKTRSYYTEFARALPRDTVILTAGCAKYRYNKLDLGDIGGIPRVLDAGQCNDSYSLAVVALKLKEVFGLEDINDLPISYNIAWYEQKAVTVLLALLYLGVKNIHLGPTLPAFLSENVAGALVDKFGIGGISTVEDDIKAMVP